MQIALTECINALSYLGMFKENIHQLCRHTNNDPALKQLKQTIQEGCPEVKSGVPPLVILYYHIHD